jgi:hypothetical protein
MDAEFLVKALGLLSLALWLTAGAFRLGPVADRRIRLAAYGLFAFVFAFAIAMALIHFCG